MSLAIVWFSVLVILSNFVPENVEGQSSTQMNDSSTMSKALEILIKAVESLEAKIESQAITLSNLKAKVEMQMSDLESKLERQGTILRNLEALLGKAEVNVEIQATALKELVTKEEWQEPISQSPNNRTLVALESDDVEIWCVVHGTPLPEIKWTRENGTLLESGRVAIEDNGKVLRIKNVGSSDQGTYFCVAANGIGTPATQLVHLQVYDPAQECHRVFESDKGNIAIKTLSIGCLWVLKLQNTTGFRLEFDPLMTEPILVIPEQRPIEFSRLLGVLSYEIDGKNLAIVVPPGRERTTLSWTGLHLDASEVSYSTKIVNDAEGRLDWESSRLGIDKVFWSFYHKLGAELGWELNAASSTARNQQEISCKNVTFSVVGIGQDGNISYVSQNCDGSSAGWLKLEASYQLLIFLDIKSEDSQKSKLRVSWPHQDEPLNKSVDGIVAGTRVGGASVVSFNSGQTKSVFSGTTFGLTFDWNSQKIYYSKYKNGITRSNLDGSESEILVSDSSSTLFGLTIEPVSGNFYYGDRTSSTIRVCNNDASKCSTIANSSDLYVVDDIALHRSKGLLFWSIANRRVVRTNLDGSKSRVLLEGHDVRGIDVDEHEDRLYWGHSSGIRNSDLNGLEIGFVPNVRIDVADVAIVNDKIYYAGRYENGIHVISKTGTNERLLAQLTDPISHITIFGTQVSNQPENPCKDTECTHLCVVTRWSYRCLCPENQTLDVDGLSCTF